MIKNQWYAILESKEVKRGKPVSVTRLGEQMALWRNASGEVICLRDKCAHRGAMLSPGALCDNRETIECPFHGLRYDKTGKCTIIPANGKNANVPSNFRVESYPAIDRHGFIWIWWGDAQEEYPPLPFFDDIDDNYSYATFTEVWPVHYSRAIENQLDVVHLPFVHRTTIGRGDRVLVNGPLVEMDADGNGFTIWVNNVIDDGKTVPIRHEEFPAHLKQFHLQFKFPHVWKNNISEMLKLTICFVPIDEEHTLFYLRFYQRFMTVPVLKNIINYTSRFLNRKILHQDRAVVITQDPKKSWLKMGENLIQGDRPIVEYRKIREKLVEKGK